jgi:hypothetical protein
VATVTRRRRRPATPPPPTVELMADGVEENGHGSGWRLPAPTLDDHDRAGVPSSDRSARLAWFDLLRDR